MSNRNSKVINIQISKVGYLTQIIKKVSTVISEGFLIFVQPDSKGKKGGIVLQQTSEDKNIFVDMRLESINFDKFECADSETKIGIDLKNFFTVLNLIKKDVSVSLYMRRNSMNTLYIRSIEPRPVKTDFILLALDNQQIPNMQLDGRCKFQVDKTELRSICAELNAIVDKVLITISNDTMTFNATCKEIGVIEKSMDASYLGAGNVKVYGEYDVSKVLTFVDYVQKDKRVEIVMDKNFPLVLLFDVPNLGTMKVSFSPIDPD